MEGASGLGLRRGYEDGREQGREQIETGERGEGRELETEESKIERERERERERATKARDGVVVVVNLINRVFTSMCRKEFVRAPTLDRNRLEGQARPVGWLPLRDLIDT